MSAENNAQPIPDELAKAQRDRKTLDYLVTILGFGLCRGWIVFCFSAPLIGGGIYASNWIYLVAGAFVALLVAFASHRTKANLARTRRTLYWITAATVVLAAIFIPLAFALRFEALLLVGFVIGGAGAGLLQVLWGDRFACHEVRFATIASPAAAIVTALLVAVSSAETNLIGFTVFPLLSFGLLVFAADRTGLGYKELLGRPLGADGRTDDLPGPKADAAVLAENADSASQPKQIGIEVGKLMFSIMIFSFLCRIFDAMPNSGPDPFGFFGGSAIFALIVVGCAFLAFVAMFKDRFNSTLTYRLSLPIMVAGFVAIALFFDTHAALSVLLINIGYEFFDILSWVLFTEVSKRKNENALHIFGLGVAFMFIGMSLGYLAGDVLDTLILSGDIQITVVAMMSTLCLVIVAFMVIPEGTIAQLTNAVRPDKKDQAVSADAEEEPHPAETFESRLESNCTGVAETYGLTPRESEVIVLLAYGRTLSIIARDLQIAKGTARTHIENIYRKLDVHKQQELIDLVEHFEPTDRV